MPATGFLERNDAHPQAALRFASPLAGGNASGPAEPDPRRSYFFPVLTAVSFSIGGIFMTTRRPLVLSLLAAAAALSTPGLALAQAKLKVAAIYTVPFEQQWVSRMHKALKAAEARGEIEYKASENVSPMPTTSA
jgi:hypothetical protein